MRLILNQYLSSLREREELDAILPDLLSQMGLIVTSKPSRGTKQHGVDIAAKKEDSNGNITTYLFSIKSGDLNRNDWNGSSNQALKPSLDEIINNYYFSKLSDEQRKGKVTICLCFGGFIHESIIGDVNGYIAWNIKENINFEIWNGDKLSQLIIDNFLNEALMPESVRKNLRKSLAMIDDPQSSFIYFQKVITELLKEEKKRKGATLKNKLITIRQISLCLWILHSWSRDLKNLESAYLSSEFCILTCWSEIKGLSNSKVCLDIKDVFEKIVDQYFILNDEILIDKICPLTNFRDGITLGVFPPCKYAINFNTFDLMGKLATYGIWLIWKCRKSYHEIGEADEGLINKVRTLQKSLANLINNNSTSLLPFKDDNTIDLVMASYFLMLDSGYTGFVKSWVKEITNRASYTLNCGRNYPMSLAKYSEFLEDNSSNEYKKEVTKASILYSSLAFLAALLGDSETYLSIRKIKNESLSHCNIQIWFPSVNSEEFYYRGGDIHGVVLSNVPLEKEANEFLEIIIKESDLTQGYDQLSAIKDNYLPIIFLASRCNRFPIPIKAFADEFEEEILSQISNSK